MIEQIPDNLATRLEEMDRQMVSIAEGLLDPDVLSDHNTVRELSMKKAALEGPVSRWREIVALEKERVELEDVVKTESDQELLAMAREELLELAERRSGTR